VDSKKSLFEMLLSQSDSLIRERMLTLVVNETKLLKTTILEELKKYEKKNQLLQGISIVDYLAEGEILAKEVDKFDEFRWKTNELIGLKTGFPFFDENMDGLQIGLHEVGGKWNVGKSSFILNLALHLLEDENNPLFNRAVSGEFPSGSTVKPVFAAAALEEGIISENTTFISNGGVRVSQWFFQIGKLEGMA